MTTVYKIDITTSPAPVLSNERAQILDVLRGFAILGILLDNMFGFTGYFFMGEEQMQALPTWPADGILGMLELAFVHGKFYSLFSLLFGIGFSIILWRNEQKGVNPMKIFYRRMLVLLIIGFVHVYFMWPGDILLLYAILGFILPVFRKASNKTLLYWAAALILSPILIDVLKVVFQFRTGAFLETIAEKIDKRNGINSFADLFNFIYGETAGWNEFWKSQQAGFLYRYAYIIESNRIPKVLGMFLLGLYVGRKRLYAHIGEHVQLLKKLKKWGFLIGIPVSIAMAFFEIDGKRIPAAAGLWDTISYAFGVVPLSLAYTAAICLAWFHRRETSFWNRLTPAGRMALTNYLVQTIICVFLFYSIGFRLGGNIGPSLFFPIAVAIYILQVVFSTWWLRHFNYGPVEWIWRQLTYGKILPLKKTKELHLSDNLKTPSISEKETTLL